MLPIEVQAPISDLMQQKSINVDNYVKRIICDLQNKVIQCLWEVGASLILKNASDAH